MTIDPRKRSPSRLFEAIPYCIELMEGPIVTTDPEVVTAFRPKKKTA